jgi:Uma2 family endonuclease
MIMPYHAFRQRYYTYHDYYTWPEGERWELIDSKACNMSPELMRRHQQVVVELGRQITNFLQNHRCQVYMAPFDVRLPRSGEANDLVATLVQTDLLVICDHEKLNNADCRGAPDWIIEVLLPATVVKDQIEKRKLYQRHGVKEC